MVAAVRDTLLRAADADLYQVYWTDDILDEAVRTLVAQKRITLDQANRLLDALRDAFPEAMVTGYQELIPMMPNHPKDRHVAAAAVKCGAEVIVARASRVLGELNGIAAAIPNDAILVNALALQEAKDSSQIENIVTTHDELFRANASISEATPSAREVTRYAHALRLGYRDVREREVLATSSIADIQAELEPSRPGFRKVLGTTLRDGDGKVVYTPPDPPLIADLMSDLERFIHGDIHPDLDPLVRMAIAHHQFESIHPFYDANGRTGRILNVLMLIREGLLDTPILYMSRSIVRTKAEYYRLLQAVRATDDAPEAWEAWLIYMAEAVYSSAAHEGELVAAIAGELLRMKQAIRTTLSKIYSHDLLNNLFTHPYTKIELVERDLDVTRITATKYLNALTEHGFLTRIKAGRSYYYVNHTLLSLLLRYNG